MSKYRRQFLFCQQIGEYSIFDTNTDQNCRNLIIMLLLFLSMHINRVDWTGTDLQGSVLTRIKKLISLMFLGHLVCNICTALFLLFIHVLVRTAALTTPQVNLINFLPRAAQGQRQPSVPQFGHQCKMVLHHGRVGTLKSNSK